MSRLHWIALGLVSVGLLLYMMTPFVDVLVYGIFVYYILRPLYGRINKGIHSKDLSAGLSILIVVVPILLLLFYALSVASSGITLLLSSIDDPMGERIHKGLYSISESVRDLDLEVVRTVIQENQDLGKFILYLSKSTLGLIFKFILVFAVAFYLLKYGSDVRSWFMSMINTQKERMLTESLFGNIDADLQHIFFGNILVAFVTAVLGIIVLAGVDVLSPSEVINVPYPILLGVLCGVANLIPVVGMKVVWIPMVAYMWFNAYVGGILVASIWFLVASMLAIYFIVDWFPDIVLRPYLSGSDRIPMGVLFFTYIFGATIFGFSGILIGPIVVVTTLNFLEIVLPEIKKRT